MNKFINQKGMTLIELLAVIIIVSIISIFLFSIITKAIENTDNIKFETQLRDEADIIVSQFIKKLYSVKQENIIYNKTDSNGSYLEITTDPSKCQRNEHGAIISPTECAPTLYKMGFEKDSTNPSRYLLRMDNSTTYKPMTGVQVLNTSKIVGDPLVTSVYEIQLDLYVQKKSGMGIREKTMKFTNSIQPITK